MRKIKLMPLLIGITIIITLVGIIIWMNKNTENFKEEQGKTLEELNIVSEMNYYNETQKVNIPQLLTGMLPIKFNMPNEESMGEIIKTDSSDNSWYQYGIEYETKKWANAQTKDGSLWVWIPRYAYKINKETQTFDIVFLIGTTDYYYNENGKISKAQRATKENTAPDTNGSKYTVHPVFTNESEINYQNGGWDKELPGIWVAKFEAGYASGNNDTEIKESSISYNNYNKVVYANKIESKTKEDSNISQRNWLDGRYKDTETKIKYPTFRGSTYSFNYINTNECYHLAKVLTEEGNIYGLDKNNADSHLMKNSEWGAIAYLSASKYGKNQEKIAINNINLNNGNSDKTKEEGNELASVYAVTGCTGGIAEEEEKRTTIENINKVSGNTPTIEGVYVWNQKNGQNASTTGTIYGIYDISGGLWERTAGCIANGNSNLLTYGRELIEETKMQYDEITNSVIENTGTSTKYVTIYPNSEDNIEKMDTSSQKNFASNTKIYADAIRETTSEIAGTAKSDWSTSTWNNNYSMFPGKFNPFFYRGGYYGFASRTGMYSFLRTVGGARYYSGFRVVLIPSKIE